MMSEPSGTHLNSLFSRFEELRNFDENLKLQPEKENFLNDRADEIERKINQIIPECSWSLSSLTNEDMDKCLEDLKKELSELQGEDQRVESDIEDLSARCFDDYDTLENDLERMTSSSEFIDSKDPEKANENMQIDDCCIASASKFKMLEQSHLIEKKSTALKTMQELDFILKRFEAVEKIKDASSGCRMIEVVENSIRLSLNTNIPFLESVLHRQDIEGLVEALELNHELIIETVDGTLELKKVEIFPDDVYIGEIIDAAKSFRQISPMFPVIETMSSLEWFVRRVHDRIALSSLRRFVVKNAKKSRHSYEYLDREDVIVAHMVCGVDAFVKLPRGWPISELALDLMSLKSTSQNKEISLSFLYKIVEAANSLNPHVRHNISNFTNSIEEIIMQQMPVTNSS